MTINATGSLPCGASIEGGTPVINYSGNAPEVTVKYTVPADQFCCFKRTMMGTWSCSPQTAAPAFTLPCVCKADPASTDNLQMEPVSISVVTPANTVGECDATVQTAAQLADVVYNPRCNGKPALLKVAIKYRHCQRVASGAYIGAGETPVQVAFPACLNISKQAGIDGRTVRDGLKWCTDSSSSTSDQPCCEGDLPADATMFLPIQTDNITVRVSSFACPRWSVLKSLRGAINDRVFLGYPPGAVLYNGYTERERQDCYCRPIYDIDFQMIAKTVPACPGEPSQLNGCVGFWGKAYCPVGRTYTSEGDPDDPDDDTECVQHWLPVCNGDATSPIFPSGNLRSLFLI